MSINSESSEPFRDAPSPLKNAVWRRALTGLRAFIGDIVAEYAEILGLRTPPLAQKPLDPAREFAERLNWANRVRYCPDDASFEECIRAAEILNRDVALSGPHKPVRGWHGPEPENERLEAILMDPECAPAFLESLGTQLLAERPSWSRGDLLEIVASHPNTPASVLCAIGSAGIMSFALTHNPSCPPELLRELSRDTDRKVRQWVSLHPRTPDDVVEELRRETGSWVRAGIVLRDNRASARPRSTC